MILVKNRGDFLCYKLLALDLDDTLLNAQSGISAQNKDAIMRATKSGVLVTLATGRMFRSALPYARELAIELPLITYHGALVRTARDEETIYHRPVPLQLAKSVAEHCRERGYHVNAYMDDELFVEEENDFSRYYQSIAKIKVTAVGDLIPFLSEPPTKLTVINRDGKLPLLQQELRALYGDELSILISRPHFLEITDRRATKGHAVKFLAQRHGIERKNVAAIGDSYNDVDMLLYAGMGVAVANAPDDVRAAADFITLSNEEDGVAFFIDEYLLKCEEGV